jgi:hypothetical protein
VKAAKQVVECVVFLGQNDDMPDLATRRAEAPDVTLSRSGVRLSPYSTRQTDSAQRKQRCAQEEHRRFPG